MRQLIFIAPLLFLLTTIFPQSHAHKVCVGNTHVVVSNLQELRRHFTNCTFVYGDVILHSLRRTSNLDFLNSLQEIYGSFVVSKSCLGTLKLAGLRIIRQTPDRFPRKSVIQITGSPIKNCTTNLHFPELVGLIPSDEWPVVQLKSSHSCYLFYRVNWSQFSPSIDANLIVKQQASFCSVKPEDYPCHKRCPVWEDGERYCWGPFYDQCQQRGSQKSSCHPQCLGGCSGPTSRDCFTCRNFNNSGSCIGQCEKGTYILGSLCVTKCPIQFTERGLYCIYDPPAVTMKCLSSGSNLLCSGNNPLMDTKAPCTEYHGDLDITDECFGSPHNMTPESLHEALRNLKTVYGHVTISLSKTPWIRDLRFLSSLQSIRSPFFWSPRRPSLTVISQSIEFLGTSSLRQLDTGLALAGDPDYLLGSSLSPESAVSFCGALFPTSAAFSEGLVDTKLSVLYGYDNFKRQFYSRVQCPSNNSCSDHCDSRYGCWGPSPQDCVANACPEGSDSCNRTCPAACEFCEGSKCLRCRGVTEDGQCKYRCSKGRFANSAGNCEKCSPLCLDSVHSSGFPICQGPQETLGPNGCTFCLKFFNRTCFDVNSTCPRGLYDDIDFLTSDELPVNYQFKSDFSGRLVGKCFRCADKCTSCSGSSTQCTGCAHLSLSRPGKPLFCSEKPNVTNHLSLCPEGFHADFKSRICSQCHPDCQKCHGPDAKQCLMCRGYLVSWYFNGTLNCLLQCPRSHPFVIEVPGGRVCSETTPRIRDSEDRFPELRRKLYQPLEEDLPRFLYLLVFMLGSIFFFAATLIICLCCGHRLCRKSKEMQNRRLSEQAADVDDSLLLHPPVVAVCSSCSGGWRQSSL